jgi:hydroxymethylbilane synthase
VKKREIVVGARGSLLSVCQTESVIRLLKRKAPGFSFALKKITTLGDRVKEWQRTDKGIFVKELEDSLLSGDIDIAVHSAKDLPTQIPEELELAAVTGRLDPRDLLVSREKTAGLLSLKSRSVVGTSSLRRKAQVLALRPDLAVRELRGNLDTRIRKLSEGLYDAIIVANAGVKRLGYKNLCAKSVDTKLMLPSVAQAALAIEARKDDLQVLRLVKKLDDPKTHICILCERAFLRKTGAGCRMPVAAMAKIKGREIHIEGLIISLDGEKHVRLSRKGSVDKAEKIGEGLAEEVLEKGGREILAEIENV